MRSRVTQAIDGKPHTGPLPQEVRDELDEISRRAHGSMPHHLHSVALYFVEQFRSLMRILEPSERIDPYARWVKRSDVPNREPPEARQQEPPRCVPAEARLELANPNCRLEPKDYTTLARAYVLSCGTGASGGLDALTEVFSVLQPVKITNTFTSAHHFSRLHLSVIDDTVFAMCRLCQENGMSVPVSP